MGALSHASPYRTNMAKRPKDMTTPCAVCRLKKRKCDRRRPTCGGCKQRGLEDSCSYELKDMPRSSGGSKSTRPSMGVPSTPTVVIQSSHSEPSTVVDGAGSRANEPDDVQMQPAPGSGQDDAIEISSVHSDQSFHTADPAVETPYSPTLQLRRLQRIVGQRIGDIKVEESAEDDPFSAPEVDVSNGDVSRFAHRGPQFASPGITYDLADQLVRVYLTREYVNLPIFDLAKFRVDYETAKKQDQNIRPSFFYGILNVIFAIANVGKGRVDGVDVSRFFEHGQKLIRELSPHGSPWERVQSDILQTQYACATGNPKLAWSSIGYAIRTAQVLGLHSKTGGHDVRRKRDRELARRLWHSAMILERMLALQVGIAPQTRNPLHVPLPTHLDTDYIDEISGGQPGRSTDRPSTIEFLTACARLYSHVEEIMAWEDEVRIRTGGCAFKKMLALETTPFLKIDGLLYDWHLSLPSYLQMGKRHDQAEDPIVRRQRIILRTRYLYLRLRLYRPLMIMGMALSGRCNCRPGGAPHITSDQSLTPDSPIVLGLIRDSSIKCARVVEELADILFGHDSDLPRGNPFRARAPIYSETIDHLYACGIVSLAVRQCPFISRDVNNDLMGCYSKVTRLLEDTHAVASGSRTKQMTSLCLSTLRSLSNATKGPRLTDTENPDLWNDATTALGPDMQSRLFQRTETDAKGEAGSRRRTLNGEADGVPAMPLGYLGWVESLPVDLDGEKSDLC